VTLKLVILPRAERDVQRIFEWISDRSPEGAVRWWNTFEEAASRSVDNPERYGLAPENGLISYELRQFLFKTPHGRTYRGVFTLAGNEVRILRVRGPGQPPLDPDELD
jgi:plasmid stabilization system protein ParE